MLHEYENHLLALGRANGTIHHRMSHIEQLAREYPDLTAVTLEDLERMLARAVRADHKPETRKNQRASYRVFYDWAYRTGRMAYDPAFYLETIQIPITVARLAPDDAVQRSLVTATTEQRAMVLLGRLACLRLSELTTLKLRDRRGDWLVINGKGDKQRVVPVNDQLMDALLVLEREVGDSTYYFAGRFGGHMHPQSVNKIITRVTGWNPHSLRHAGATAAFRATRDLRGVQELLGHASISTTQRYLHLDEDAMRAVGRGTAFTTPVPLPHFPQFGERQNEPMIGGRLAA
jgi:site-specific recombinase XerD